MKANKKSRSQKQYVRGVLDYRYFVFDAEGGIIGGFQYKSDANDLKREIVETGGKAKVLTLRGKKLKEAQAYLIDI